jgi:hypothetical protein
MRMTKQNAPAIAPTRAVREDARKRSGSSTLVRTSSLTIGNQAMLRRLNATALRIQPKLLIGAVDDPLEHEADEAADQVMRMPDPDMSVAAAPPQVSRKCAACEEEDKKLHAKSNGALAQGAEAPASVYQVRSSVGRPLDPASRAFFEPRFGQSFSGVRIHDDSLAADSARSVGALAYTVGQHVVFGPGQSGLESEARLRLLAHELAHVVQQRETGQLVRRTPCRSAAECKVSTPGNPSTFGADVDKAETARAATLSTAPAGSKEAALQARMGERAVHFENLLTSHGTPLRPEVAGFFVNSHSDPNVVGAQTTQCSNFPGGSPGTPPAPADKFCVQIPAETEDEAAALDIVGPPSAKQAEETALLLGMGVHEMQHAKFDAVQEDPAIRTIAAEADCSLDTKIPPADDVEGLLSEISAITGEFPVFFKNIAHTQNPAATLEREEQRQAFDPDESLLGAIKTLQCGCSCATVETFVTQAVNQTTAGWPADQLQAYLKTMTMRIPGIWPKALKRT